MLIFFVIFYVLCICRDIQMLCNCYIFSNNKSVYLDHSFFAVIRDIDFMLKFPSRENKTYDSVKEKEACSWKLTPWERYQPQFREVFLQLQKSSSQYVIFYELIPTVFERPLKTPS